MTDPIDLDAIQHHVDTVTAALDNDELGPDQYQTLAKAVHSYATRRFGEACADIGRVFRAILDVIPTLPTGPMTPVEPCACLCGAVHRDRMGICTGEASTTRELPKRTHGRGEINVCGECAQAWDTRGEEKEPAP